MANGQKRHKSLRGVQERNVLVAQYYPLVHSIVRDVIRIPGVRPASTGDDLFQTGVIGLMRAAELWDETVGVKFISYAHRPIKREMMEGSRGQGVVRVPYWWNKTGGARRATPSSVEAAAKAANVTCLDCDVPLDRVAGRPDDADALLDDYLDLLTRRERSLLCNLYGLRGRRKRSCLQVAKSLGVTKQCVSLWACKAVRKLRVLFAEAGWDVPKVTRKR